MASQPLHEQRFYVLDAMRGVAALFIVWRHLRAYLGGPSVGANYLAVDFFFQLSGFVLAHSYEQAFLNGLSLVRFTLLRIVRLYPLYILGTVISIIGLVGFNWLPMNANKASYHLPHFSWLMLLANALCGILFLPSPFIAWQRINPIFPLGFFPLNYAAWSLFYELVVNIVYRLGIFRLSNRLLGMFILAAALLLSRLVIGLQGLDFSSYWATFSQGFVRVGFSFFTGVFLYRMYVLQTSEKKISSLLLVILLACVFVPRVGVAQQALFDLAAVFCAFPVLIFLGAGSEVRTAAMRTACTLLGKTSYALYALHVPLLLLGLGFFRPEWINWLSLHWLISWSLLPIFMMAVALLADHYYDEPIRGYIKQALRRKSRPAKPNLRHGAL